MKLIEPTFLPFDSVDGVRPGTATFADARRVFGTPNRLQRRRRSSACIAPFRKRGVWVILDGPEDEALVNGIYVEAPYAGSTPQGVCIGFGEADAREILGREYVVTMRVQSSVYFARPERPEADDFQVWFEDGRVVRMKIFAHRSDSL